MDYGLLKQPLAVLRYRRSPFSTPPTLYSTPPSTLPPPPPQYLKEIFKIMLLNFEDTY